MVERSSRVIAKLATFSIIVGEDKGKEDGFCRPRLGALVGPVFLIVVDGRDFLPEANALCHICEEQPFVLGGSLFAEHRAKCRSCESIGHICVARNTKGALLARRFLPAHPPLLSLIKVSCRGL